MLMRSWSGRNGKTLLWRGFVVMSVYSKCWRWRKMSSHLDSKIWKLSAYSFTKSG